MTFRERLAKEHPDLIDEIYEGGCFGCPFEYGYVDAKDDFKWCASVDCCTTCWNSTLEEEQKPIQSDEAQIISNTIEKCAEVISKSMRCESCPVDCLWGTEQKCKDMLAQYLKTQIEEQKNEL